MSAEEVELKKAKMKMAFWVIQTLGIRVLQKDSEEGVLYQTAIRHLQREMESK